MHYKIASLILNSGQKSNMAADIFIAQPDGYKEALAGKLFVLAEMESQKNDGLKLINFLINALNANYYTSEKIILREKINTITVENIFESALAKTNKDFAEFLAEEKIKISPYSLNITVGVLFQNELYLSSLGKNKNYLIYKEKIKLRPKRGQATQEAESIEYRAADLSPERADGEGISANKIFSEVSGGKIPAAGYFLVINEAMSEYLSPKQLIKIATKLPPAAAMEQIKNTLEQVNSFVSFLGILIKNTAGSALSEEELKKKTEKELEKFDSRPEIIAIEEKTEEVLAPTGLLNLKKRIDGIFKKSEQKNQSGQAANFPTAQSAAKPTFMLKDKVFFRKRQSLISLKKISSLFKKIFSGLKKLIFARSKNTFNEEEKTDIEKRKSGGKNKTKFAVLAILIIAAIFSANLIITKQRQKNAAILKSFNEKISTIEKNINKIEANLLYGNNSDAQDVWQENEKLLNEIPEKDKKRETIITFQQKQAELSEKIRQIVRVKEEDTKIIADFSKLNSAAEPKYLIISGKILYAAGQSSPTIYKADLEENIVTASYDLPNIGNMNFLATEGGDIYSLGENGILKLNELNQSEKLNIVLPSGTKNTRGFKIYNNRVYLLDKQNGQIYRYSRIDNGFSDQTPWLNAKINLDNATDVFIDGNIYILRADGTVEKYLKGQKQNFPALAIEEPLTAASRLIIDEKKIYILEPDKKRLAVFDSTGKLSGQYIFESLSNVKDFAVDKDGKKIYLLSGTTVLEFGI